MSANAQLAIIIYTTWGHIGKLAEAQKEGALRVPGVDVTIYQVKETLPEEILKKMWAAPKPDYPVIDPHDLVKPDGFLFGVPTRYGNMPAQWKTFWDATGGLWQSQALNGKLAGVFHSTGSLGGGQETTTLTFLTSLVHHGIIFVPIGYKHPALSDISEVRGGSPYGAGTISGGDGSRQPSEKELDIARHQGEELAKKLVALKRGSA